MACGSFSDATAATNSASEEQDGRAVVHPWRNKQTLARDLCDASTLTPVTPPYSHIHLELPTIWTGLSVSRAWAGSALRLPRTNVLSATQDVSLLFSLSSSPVCASRRWRDLPCFSARVRVGLPGQPFPATQPPELTQIPAARQLALKESAADGRHTPKAGDNGHLSKH